MKAAERSAGRSAVGADRETAGDSTQGAIIPFRAPIINCANCGDHFRPMRAATVCPRCAHWLAWYSAHRIASAALRGE